MLWDVLLVDEVNDWFMKLVSNDAKTAELVVAAIDQLELHGPTLGRPLVDSVKNSELHKMKELRPGSAGEAEVRVLFVFDPDRQAVLLVAGDKCGRWKSLVSGGYSTGGATLSTLAGWRVWSREELTAMVRSWKDARAAAMADGALDAERIDALAAKMRAEARAHRLAEVRQAYGIDQSALAERLGVSQSRVSRIERGELDRSEISTVRSYVEALGGEVAIMARFGDEIITVG